MAEIQAFWDLHDDARLTGAVFVKYLSRVKLARQRSVG
jgi:hypothetical protein